MLDRSKMTLPVIAAPMFLVSGPELVSACCKSGIVGTFPALNQRSTTGFREWLVDIEKSLEGHSHPGYGVNLIVHKSNPRVEADLEVCIEHKVPLIITSLGAVPSVVERVQAYGGQVFHDVINLRHAQKAADAGVDGLIAVSAGAGGHAGTMHPFSLLGEIRRFFDKTLLLSGCISKGGDVAAAIAAGADYAYMGTRFIATKESRAESGYKDMVHQANAADIIYTDKVSGVNANFLKASLDNAGFDYSDSVKMDNHEVDIVSELNVDGGDEAKAWKDLWSAGHGVGNINESPAVAELVDRLQVEFSQAADRLKQ